MKPNPHPYAIRTTSTGLLTRSNSSGHNTAASRHHYVPMPSHPNHRRDARRRSHKHTKSLNEASYLDLGSPQPLPVPASFISNARSALRDSSTHGLPEPRRRAETLPPNVTGSNIPVVAATAEKLPLNPKLWTPSQLSSYLVTTLRQQDPEVVEAVNLPPTAVLGIVEFVQDTKLSGRIFLRLNEEDMATMSINVSWRDALLAASRNLRQNVIKGRIWGVGTDSPPSSSHSSSLPSQPFSPLYDSSSSSVELTDEEDSVFTKRRRVRGRVRGMVESFERSGSFSSESGLDDDDDVVRPDRAAFKQWLAENAVPENAVDVVPSIASPVEASVVAQEAPPFVEEPTVEALLAETESLGAWGARAWEEFDGMGLGVTVKRVSEHVAEDAPRPISAVNADRGTWMQSLKRGSLAKRQKERRVVTAVFAPAVEEQAPGLPESSMEQPPDAIRPLNLHEQTEYATQTPLSTPELDADVPYSQLEAELQATRALVDAYKKRLNDVECKLAEYEQLNDTRQRQTLQPHPVAIVDVQVETSSSQTLGRLEESSGSNGSASGPTSTLVSKLLAVGPSLVPSVLKRALLGLSRAPTTRTRDHARTQGEPDSDTPSSISELPQYVLLVSLGVCAVVLRLMLKKAANRRA